MGGFDFPVGFNPTKVVKQIVIEMIDTKVYY